MIIIINISKIFLNNMFYDLFIRLFLIIYVFNIEAAASPSPLSLGIVYRIASRLQAGGRTARFFFALFSKKDKKTKIYIY